MKLRMKLKVKDGAFKISSEACDSGSSINTIALVKAIVTHSAPVAGFIFIRMRLPDLLCAAAVASSVSSSICC